MPHQKMTVRATFYDKDGTELVMLFGNSYKTWKDQLTEFTYRRFGNKLRGWRYKDVEGRLLKLERSFNNWPQNGLKWCSEKEFQSELNRESKNPRQYSTYRFRKIPNSVATIELKRYK